MTKHICFRCNSGCAVGSTIYAIDNSSGVLFRFTIPTFEQEVISCRLRDQIPIPLISLGVEVKDNSVYISDRFCRNIYVYDLGTGLLEKFGDDCVRAAEMLNRSMHLIDEYIYIMPCKISNPILVFDINKREFVEPITIPSEGKGALFGAVLFEGKLWFCERKTRKLYSLDCSTKDITSHELREDILIDNIGCGIDGLIISDYLRNTIYKWDKEKLIKLGDVNGIPRVDDKIRIGSFIEHSKGLVLVPPIVNKLAIAHKESFEEEIVNISIDQDIPDISTFVYGHFVIDGNILLLPHGGNCFMCIDENLNITIKESFIYNKEFLISEYSDQGIFYEGTLSLEDFCKMM